MRKAISLLLIVLLLLNVMGYYAIFLGLKYANIQQVTQRLDADQYNLTETVTIKIPLSIPYYGDTDFSRMDGEIEYLGRIYRMVKQKFERDTLHIMCIHDTQATYIQNALTERAKTFVHQSADGSNTKTIDSFINDYVPASFSLDTVAGAWTEMLHLKTVGHSDRRPYITVPSPPPKG